MRGHRRFGILLAALAVFLLLPLSGRPVKADTSALELYVPQETEEQQEHREDGTSARRLLMKRAALWRPFLQQCWPVQPQRA